MTEEEELINRFVVASKRERLCLLLANPKRRAKATSSLAHFRDLDPRWMVALPADQQNAAAIERALRARGSDDWCHVISEESAIDGQRLRLRAALDRVVGHGMGSLLSCIPGRLGYYEGEGPSDRYILERRAI